MNTNQLYPFQRNRYYSGKLLTSADFQAEQDYFSNKNRFMNSLVYGSGIICGLGVISLDDLSILVESGVAIDGQGHEIVLDNSVVKKLSAIEGFDELTSDTACLCIKYDEQPVHSVYAINKGQGSQEYEYSRISEGSKLFLIDKNVSENPLDIETEFLSKSTLYLDEDYMVEVILPATVSKGSDVKITVQITKNTNLDSSFTLHSILQLPAFVTPDDKQEITIDLNDIVLSQGEIYKKEYWVTVQKNELEDTLIILKSGSARAYINDEAVSIPSDFEMKILLSEVSPRELVNREIGRLSLEMLDLGSYDEYIRLADIKLEKTLNAYIITGIEETAVKRYVATPSQELVRAGYLDYFFKNVDIRESAFLAQNRNKQDVNSNMGIKQLSANIPEIATGILEIPLGNGARKGEVRFSGEVIHGLGKGNVYVQIGFESVSDDPSLGVNAKSTIYGNADLFRTSNVSVPNVETAIKVLNDKGSFVVAAKLDENVDFLILTYRWVAIKFPSENEIVTADDIAGKSIITETPTVILGTKESHFFGVRFENMETCSIVYELTEEGSGEITSDGIYTAPNKEGVYEIRIYCADKPMICAYAYAIVKKNMNAANGLENAAEADTKKAGQEGSILDDLPV